jgi:hypothetical protein
MGEYVTPITAVGLLGPDHWPSMMIRDTTAVQHDRRCPGRSAGPGPGLEPSADVIRNYCLAQVRGVGAVAMPNQIATHVAFVIARGFATRCQT